MYIGGYIHKATQSVIGGLGGDGGKGTCLFSRSLASYSCLLGISVSVSMRISVSVSANISNNIIIIISISTRNSTSINISINISTSISTGIVISIRKNVSVCAGIFTATNSAGASASILLQESARQAVSGVAAVDLGTCVERWLDHCGSMGRRMY